MKNILLFFGLAFFTSCNFNNSLEPTNTSSSSLDYRDFAMGSFEVDIYRSYSFFNPNISNYSPPNKLNITVYRSTYADDELIISGIHNECIYATMNGNRFSFSFIETNLRPENLGFNITPPCPSCKIYMSGSGSVSELERGMNESRFRIKVELNYDGLKLVEYSGSKLLSLPRPVTEANDC